MKTVFVNGTFDVLHPGHLALLNFARLQGDRLLVGIDSDRRVQELKGPARPINNQNERKLLLECLRCVDQVEIFDSDQDLIDLIAKSSIMVKGSDYRGQPIVGTDVCPEIVFFERNNDYSSTRKIQDIINR